MKKNVIASAILLALSGAAQAEVRINGFANLVGGVTSSEDTLYGFDDNPNFSEWSLFALQLSSDINDKMTATAQLVARGSDDFDVDFEWAYLTMQLNDNSSISAGRLRLPMFRYSASLDVGYSYHWITPPRNIYDVSFNNYDGIRYDYSNFAGDWEYNIQLALGNYKGIASGGVNTGDNLYAITTEATYESLKLRAVYGAVNDSTFTRPDIDGLLAQINAVSPELRDFLAIEDDTGEFIGLGLEYDQFSWFASAEITHLSTDDSFNPDDLAWYFTAGFRHGKWTPSVTIEKLDGLADDIRALDIVATLPSEAQAQVTPFVVGVQQAAADKFDVVTATLRYDYDTNIAFKADISKYSDDINDENDAVLIRLAVNYVF